MFLPGNFRIDGVFYCETILPFYRRELEQIYNKGQVLLMEHGASSHATILSCEARAELSEVSWCCPRNKVQETVSFFGLELMRSKSGRKRMVFFESSSCSKPT